MNDSTKASESGEQGFNESELADIMKEIEGLEKDFKAPIEEDRVAVEEDLNKALKNTTHFSEQQHFTQNSLQAEIDKELGKVGPTLDDEAESEMTAESPSNVVSLAKERTTRQSSSVASATSAAPMKMQFDVAGTMGLSMAFCINGKTIELTVDADSGLSINLPGGVKFSVPVTDEASQKTKKAV